MDNNLLSMLGLAKKAGMLTAGEEPVEAVARAKDARVLLLASDAADNTRRRCERFAEMGSCLWLRTPFTKAEMGQALGRSSVAIAALTDIGFASAIVRRMAQADPVRYDEAAEKLEVKARRAAQRKAEQMAHEKNLRAGKVRPKAAKTAEPAPEPEVLEAPPRRGVGRPPARPGGGSRGYGGNRPARPAGERSAGADRLGRSEKKRPGRPCGDWSERDGGHPSGTGRAASWSSGGRRSGPSNGTWPAKGPGGFGGKGSGRPKGKPNPYAHSRPVKKGKGSFRKKEG